MPLQPPRIIPVVAEPPPIAENPRNFSSMPSLISYLDEDGNSATLFGVTHVQFIPRRAFLAFQKKNKKNTAEFSCHFTSLLPTPPLKTFHWHVKFFTGMSNHQGYTWPEFVALSIC